MVISSGFHIMTYGSAGTTKIMPAPEPAQTINKENTRTLARASKRRDGQEEMDFQSVFKSALEQMNRS
jgi:hypothetical protein